MLDNYDRHPLYPMLVLLLEKCEMATKSAETQTSSSLNDELKHFLQRLHREKSCLVGTDKETNELVKNLDKLDVMGSNPASLLNSKNPSQAKNYRVDKWNCRLHTFGDRKHSSSQSSKVWLS